MTQPMVETASGRVRGIAAEGAQVFCAIPYAAAPTGRLRWRAPSAPEPWTGVRDALAFGPVAPQQAGLVARLLGSKQQRASEDCLSLTVWTPACDVARRPVLVWIHGGGFTVGASSWPVYDAAALAARGDVVVVSINYRLGALGFLALPGSDGDRGDGATANFGLLDQIAALEWVRDNVAEFGGDPSQVTLLGNSAGAMSIGTLLAVPRAHGLFQRAVLQSGAARNVHDRDTAERVAATFCAELGGCPEDIDVLRSRSVALVLDAQVRTAEALRGVVSDLAFQPAVDDRLLPRKPVEALAAGEIPPLPLLVGTNLDEWKFYGLRDPKAQQLDEAGLLRRCNRNLPGVGSDGRAHAERVVDVYRDARESRGESVEAKELWFAIESDRWFRVPACDLAERHPGPTWSYLFTWPSPALGGAVGSCHCLEIPFLFGVESEVGRRFAGEDPAAAQLSNRMQDAWLAFAREGSPRTDALPDWRPYCAAERNTQLLGARCPVVAAPREPERAVWQSLAWMDGPR